jgi:hypothetical protein
LVVRSFAPLITTHDGAAITTLDVRQHLHARAWLTDAARLLNRTPEALAAELIDTMLRSGAITVRDKRLHATAEHTPVAAESLRVSFPREWASQHDNHPSRTDRPPGGSSEGASAPPLGAE